MGRVFQGRVVAEWLPDGRTMKLTEPFGFVDGMLIEWPVPAGAEIDGASIPQLLWPLGGPFEGTYRNASVIHDWYCDVRTRPWRQVHRVFYEAMIASGVSEYRAKVMYGAVYIGGPRWEQTVIANMKIALGTGKSVRNDEGATRILGRQTIDLDEAGGVAGSSGGDSPVEEFDFQNLGRSEKSLKTGGAGAWKIESPPKNPAEKLYRYQLDQNMLRDIEQFVAKNNGSLDAIEAFAGVQIADQTPLSGLGGIIV